MAMVSVSIGEDENHEYASGISVGEVIANVYGKKSGAVAANVDGEQRDLSFALERDSRVEAIMGN